MTANRNLVLFGASGDLARRMLLPSLYFLEQDGLLGADLAVVGAARAEMDDDAFRGFAREAIAVRTEVDEKVWAALARRLLYCRVDAGERSDFAALAGRLGRNAQNTYYLSLSPSLYSAVCGNLKEAGLAGGENRVVIEKPIGHDLKSCRAINACVADAFDEPHVFRVDHYLGKETVQNLLALRFGNVLFEPLWNAAHIEHVEITVAESLGVEGRTDYYDSYGALRDMVQNHIIQLLCLVAMEPPAKLDPGAVRDEKVKVLRSLKPIRDDAVRSQTARGQYAGYGGTRATETFVAVEAALENWRWTGVPFYLRTGKRLSGRHTEVVIQFRALPHSVFEGEGARDLKANRLVIRLQPEEEISLLVMNKAPGLTAQGMRLNPLSLNLSLSDALGTQRRRIAYEQILHDALAGNPTLFVRRDESEASWAWIDGIAEGWKSLGLMPEIYEPGSHGPQSAEALIARRGYRWASLAG